MGIMSILDLIVLLVVVISVARTIWLSCDSRLLSVLVILFACVMAVVSLTTASVLSLNSATGRSVLIFFFVAMLAISAVSWTIKSARN